ncbi:uncharacterized protein M6B38_135840 [Iris pallida]|uniref:Uncharacterized protein n=1 Tax=Iris pallida TaxID=29817 RepID=A0AAX6FG15_IRIPA|nr:uncharacterized protein M6B38_135840 [Iris pallida]
MLASPISEIKLIKNKEDMIIIEENSEAKEALACFSEAPKEEATKFLLQCNGSIGTNTSPCVEESHEDGLKAQPSALGQQIAASVSQNFDAGMNRTSQPDFHTTPLSMNGKGGDVTYLRDDAKNSSSSVGTSLQYLAGNGRLQEIQVGASSMRRPDVGLCPLGSAPVELDLQSVKQKLESGTTHYISQKETTVLCGLDCLAALMDILSLQVKLPDAQNQFLLQLHAVQLRMIPQLKCFHQLIERLHARSVLPMCT